MSLTITNPLAADHPAAPLFIPYFATFARNLDDVFALVDWERGDVVIPHQQDPHGTPVFQQNQCEFPLLWSPTARRVVAQKYFAGALNSPGRETSLRELLTRIAETVSRWGFEQGYLQTREERAGFAADLVYLGLTQAHACNSPVQFNVGVRSQRRGSGYAWSFAAGRVEKLMPEDAERPQCSACFINSVEDTLESILDLAKTEGMLFKWGSGTGTNLSPLREENAALAGGGVSSGPLSFMKGFDAFAGVIKSGGKTRRAAKMVLLNADHPDVEAFIRAKEKEERKAHTLIAAGYDPSLDGEAYASIFYQNANNSVRAPDSFMEAAVRDEDWWTRSVLDGQPVKRYRARDLLRAIAEATHACGDPGLQFDSTIQRWHTAKASGRINASNPCSEYLFLDDSACNLASLNLLKFLEDGVFQLQSFRHAVATSILEQEILVDSSSYPTEKIAQNSHDFRPLGLGYANLGALLMTLGLPYDAEEGRAFAASITSLMSAQAYLTSAEIARVLGPFPKFTENRESMLAVMALHEQASRRLPHNPISKTATELWAEARTLGERYGYRNAQTTVLAPTGTIGFMMDCDTTGIEPDLALVKYKSLAGGGTLRIVNMSVEAALRTLGYHADARAAILAHIDRTSTAEGAPGLREEHLAVFDCSFKVPGATRTIHYTGHIRMMAAVQPFLSGAISKTINMPEEATVEEIMDAYLLSWKQGLKAVAIYRDGSKKAQPLSTGNQRSGKTEPAKPATIVKPTRRKLPDERQSITKPWKVADFEGFITVGLYEDGTPGEVFLVSDKGGSTLSGILDTLATSVSYGLQYGVPLEFFVRKYSHVRFEPSGFTGDSKIPYAKSIVDYIFRWLGYRFLGEEEPGAPVLAPDQPEVTTMATATPQPISSDAPLCAICGGFTVRRGPCYYCTTCGSSNGGCG